MIALVGALAAGSVVGLWGTRRAVSFGPDSALLALVLAAVAVLAGVGGSAGLSWPLVVVAVAGLFAARSEFRRRERDRSRLRRAAVVIEACEGIAADLRAGLPPTNALEAVGREWKEFQPVADASRLGGDVPRALRELAERPGASALRSVAAAWVVAHRSGAGLAGAVELASTAIREDRATARVIEIELASARATARLLAALPLGVLLLGRGTGGDPFAFLLGTSAGLVCLALGLGLIWVGLAWLERIARGVQG